ncbi:MAG: hypothetical protein ACYDBQ_07655 [Thermoplasmatota archaeon]
MRDVPGRAPLPASPIARERFEEASWRLFWVASTAMGLAAAAAAWWLATVHPAPVPAPSGPLAWMWRSLGPSGGPILSALFAGASVTGTAWVGRRLFHAAGVGLAAAGVVALDPSVLAAGHLALPLSVAQGASLAALALLLAPRPWVHWFAAPLLGISAMALPAQLAWFVPLGVLALLRGHIYAAPRHLAAVTAQVLLIPGAILAAGVWASGWADWGLQPACLTPAFWGSLALWQVPTVGAVALVHNPVTWFAGLAALVALGGAALVAVLARFRITRLPGRVQMRLEGPLSPGAARVLWLLVLTAAAPPALWLPLVALALAAGIQELSVDAPGFGLALAFVVLAFAALSLGRGWPSVTGANPAAALRLAPWAHLAACGGHI